MDQSQTQPMNTPGAAPEVSQTSAALPFSLRPDMTAEQAQARIHELQQDRDFGAKWLAKGNDSPEGRMMEALTLRALNQQQPAAKAEPTPTEKALAALEPPAKPEDYRLDNIRDPVTGFQVGLHGEQLPAETKALVDKTLFPAAHNLGLSQSDVSAVAMTVTKPMTWEQCEAYLHNVWKGEEFEKGLADFRLAMSNPQHRELLEQYEQLSNSGPLITSVVAAYRRRQAQQTQSVARKRPVSR